jgi:uncharacterized protein YbjT (DUF2867 family)
MARSSRGSVPMTNEPTNMPTNVLVLGAAGGIALIATDLFLRETDARLTLYLRDARRVRRLASDRVRVVEGDVLDAAALRAAMAGQDVVYANLAGDLVPMAHAVVRAMHDAGVRRLIWISSMGIHDEVPGQAYSRVLDPYRDSARVIEDSDLDYTILRPGWFTNDDAIDFRTTQKDEPFRGHAVSRKSVASLVVTLATNPSLEVRRSLGVSRSD